MSAAKPLGPESPYELEVGAAVTDAKKAPVVRVLPAQSSPYELEVGATTPAKLSIDELFGEASENSTPTELGGASASDSVSPGTRATLSAEALFDDVSEHAAPAKSTPEEHAASGGSPAKSAEAAAREVVEFDGRRPWPLGLPSLQQALAAIVAEVEIDESLEESHLRVLTMFPEWMFDEARSALGGGGNEVAWAAASAWRAVVALDRADHPVGIDLPALIALTDESVQAREKLVGASAFALDGGTASEELLSTLDECIGRFVVLARHHERTRRATVSQATRMLSVADEPEAPKRKLIPMAFGASLLFAFIFHVARLLAAPSGDVWLVNGSIDSGHAVLVPGGPHASPGALEAKIAELHAAHIVATQGPDGQWYLSKE